MKRSPLVILFITIFIDLVGFGLVIPLIPVYISHYGGTPAVGGWLLASYSIMQFIFAPIWGRLSDRYGRRPMILLGTLGSAVSFLCFGLAPNLAFLFFSRILSGALTAASLPTAQAYIADVTPPEKRAGGMAVIGAAFGLGFAFGPWLGSLLSQFAVFHLPKLATPALFAAVLSLFNFVLAFFILPESHTDRQTTHAGTEKGPLEIFPMIARAFRNPDIAAQLTVFTFATFAFAAVESCFSWLVLLRFNLRDSAAAAVTGSIFGIVGLTSLITQLAVMRGLARKAGENRLVMFGTFVLIISLLGIAFAPSLTMIRILSGLIALGNGVMTPSLSALITQSAGPQDRGALSGTQQGLGSLARIFGPPINNHLVMVNTRIPFISSAVLMSIAFGLSLRLKPLPQRAAIDTLPEIPTATEETAGHSL